jgi:hypothetical protein
MADRAGGVCGLGAETGRPPRKAEEDLGSVPVRNPLKFSKVLKIKSKNFLFGSLRSSSHDCDRCSKENKTQFGISFALEDR